MGTLAQTVLPFKLEATEELLTANAGLALFGEFVRGLGLSRWLAQEMPKPGSRRGYEADAYVTPLVLILTGGGRSLEDLRALKGDTALATALKQEALPSTDAVGDWLRRTGEGAGLAGLGRINQRIVATRLRQTGITAHTLDGDASQIVAEKEAAQFTYKGEQGYMPMIGHLAEAGVVIHDEFREGNIAPATDNLGFIQACEARLPRGHRITHVRLDSAGYQASIFNYCEETGKTFAIGGRMDAPTQKAIADIPEAAWKHYADCAVAETLHSMNGTRKAFRLIVVKHKRQAELFDDEPKYHVIASNRVENSPTYSFRMASAVLMLARVARRPPAPSVSASRMPKSLRRRVVRISIAEFGNRLNQVWGDATGEASAGLAQAGGVDAHRHRLAQDVKQDHGAVFGI